MKFLSEEDKVKVAEYQKGLGKYEKPSVTADIVAVRPAYSELKNGEWRENPKFALEIMLVKRGQWPHEGQWALPGGFIKPTDESVEAGARRELNEETALEPHPLIPVGVFSKRNRDMRAWIISNAFVSVYRKGEGCDAKGGDDAAEAKWFRIESPLIINGTFRLPFLMDGKEAFALTGTYEKNDYDGGRITSVEENPLAFDHAEIIAQAFLRMLAFDLRKLVFFFLPEEFTLSEYINIYLYLALEKFLPSIQKYGDYEEWYRNFIPNFRRQLTETKDPILVSTGKRGSANGRGHAAPMLYRRNPEN